MTFAHFAPLQKQKTRPLKGTGFYLDYYSTFTTHAIAVSPAAQPLNRP